ncbi:MAG: hypothetical protein JNM56_14955 [Planctomycetia bacterium]|nr:hypothetical protein [Planctomycetia bacterium]
MSSAAEALPLAAPSPPPPPFTAAAPSERSPWLVNPWFDLLFLANLAWPLLALSQGLFGNAFGQNLGFWAAYMLLTPHRWITLGLVFLDGERFQQRWSAYTLIFVAAAAFVFSLASLELIFVVLVIDFFWNSWHFAAQHSGIGRIYGRIARPDLTGAALLEKILLRAFVLFVLLRLALPLMNASQAVLGLDRLDQPQVTGPVSAVLGWLHLASWPDWLRPFDLPMLVLPLVLLAREIPGFNRAAWGRVTYLVSVCLLYSALLLFVHFREPSTTLPPLLGGLLLSVTFFHSIEYLAIVSWSVHKRHARSKSAVFGYLVPRWGMALMIYMAVLGMSAWMIDQHFNRAWLAITMFVSFLHYAYDGMIWKVRRPATAAAVA